MYLVLTDLLTCPRCGPEHGLIVVTDRLEQRRVLEGRLGCPNCRAAFPIVGGFADFRGESGDVPPAGSRPGDDRGETGASDAETAVRLTALMGSTAGPGYALVAGPAVRLAAAIAALVDGNEIIAIDDSLALQPEQAPVSRLGAADRIPLRDRAARGVALTGEAADVLLEEGARVLGPVGRLVLEPAPEDAETRLKSAGLHVVARDGVTLVAVRR